MKGTINRITRRIITACTFMEMYVGLTLDNDNVIWECRKTNYEFRETNLAGSIF